MRTRLLVFLFCLVLPGMCWSQTKPADLQAMTVRVETASYSGTGVVVVRGCHCFVWTAAHVVDDCQRVTRVIDAKTGQLKFKIVYDDVTIIQEYTQKGRKIGEAKLFAEIIRMSRGDHGGEDLALLHIRGENAFEKGIEFDLSGKVPAPGTGVWHVGCSTGKSGHNALSAGVFSRAGSLRKHFQSNELISPKVYDQVTLSALGGCSGGGIFIKKSGLCIGLLTEGASENLNWIVPVRRLREYAQQTKCEWAIDPRIPTPPARKWTKNITSCDIPIQP